MMRRESAFRVLHTRSFRGAAYMQYAVEGRNYVNFEFAANSGNFIRRAIAVVTVANGALSPTVRSLQPHLCISGIKPTLRTGTMVQMMLPSLGSIMGASSAASSSPTPNGYA